MVTSVTPKHDPDMSTYEAVPTTWDDLRDAEFFRIVGHVLDAHFLEGASSLLAANDPELVPVR